MAGKKVLIKKEPSRQVVCLYVDNKPNVLARVASLMGRRNFNISTITASETHMPGITRITIVVMSEDENVLAQILAQTEKLEDVRTAYLLDPSSTVYRELLLIKLRVEQDQRSALKEIVDIYRGKIISLTQDNMIIEMTGAPNKIDGFCKIVENYDIIDFCRTGVTGMERGLGSTDD